MLMSSKNQNECRESHGEQNTKSSNQDRTGGLETTLGLERGTDAVPNLLWGTRLPLAPQDGRPLELSKAEPATDTSILTGRGQMPQGGGHVRFAPVTFFQQRWAASVCQALRTPDADRHPRSSSLSLRGGNQWSSELQIIQRICWRNRKSLGQDQGSSKTRHFRRPDVQPGDYS